MLNDNDETVAAVEAWRMARASAPLQGVIASAINRELVRLVETQENLVAKANKKVRSGANFRKLSSSLESLS